MRKVIGIGETVLDIIFKDNKPVNAVPGGSAFMPSSLWVEREFQPISSAKWVMIVWELTSLIS